MATEVEQLIVRLEATQSRFEKQMDAAARKASQSANQIENRFKTMNASIGRSFGGVAAGLAGVVSIGAVKQLIDQSIRIENALKVVGLSGAELTRVYDALFASAQRNMAPVETLVTLYSRLGLAQKELGVTNDELLNFTDKVALALRVQGTTALEARGALIQLSQAMGSGTVRAEELNSILEGAPTIARAAAAGLEEAGGSVAKLRQLVVDGKVSSEAFFRAFEAGAPILEGMVAGATETIAQKMTKLQNELVNAAGEFNKTTGAANAFGAIIDTVSMQVGNFTGALNSVADTGFGRFIGKIAEAMGMLQQFYNMIGGAPGLLDMTGRLIGQATGTPAPIGSRPAPLGQKTGRNGLAMPSADRFGGTGGVTPVSLRDFKAPSSSGSGGGGRKGAKERESEYARETKSIQERIAALTAEAQAMTGLNPLAADYQMQLEKSRIARELLAAAEKSGVEITPQVKANIDALATSYAQAEVQVNKLKEAQEAQAEAARESAEFQKELVGGFVKDMMNGASAAEALSNALSKVADKLLNEVLDAMFQVKGASGGGWLQSLFGLFGGGGIDPWSGLRAASGGGTAGLLSAGSGSLSARSIPSASSISGPRASASSVQTIRVVGTFIDDGGVVKAVARQESAMVSSKAVQRYDKTGAQRLNRDAGQADQRGIR